MQCPGYDAGSFAFEFGNVLFYTISVFAPIVVLVWKNEYYLLNKRHGTA